MNETRLKLAPRVHLNTTKDGNQGTVTNTHTHVHNHGKTVHTHPHNHISGQMGNHTHPHS